MKKQATITITPRVKSNGRQVANRIIAYLEHYVYSHNDVEELDIMLNIEDKSIDSLISSPEETFDYRKYNVMSEKNSLLNSKNYLYEDTYSNYPEKVILIKRDFDDLIKFNPNCLVDGKIFGMEVEVR